MSVYLLVCGGGGRAFHKPLSVCGEAGSLHLDIGFSFHLDTSYCSRCRETQTVTSSQRRKMAGKCLLNGPETLSSAGFVKASSSSPYSVASFVVVGDLSVSTKLRLTPLCKRLSSHDAAHD